MGWNYLSIPKLQRCNRWSLGMYKLFHPTLYWACDYLSMLRLKLNHVSKRGHWSKISDDFAIFSLTKYSWIFIIEYFIKHVANGLLYVKLYSQLVYSIAIDCPYGVWCRELTTCLLYDILSFKLELKHWVCKFDEVENDRDKSIPHCNLLIFTSQMELYFTKYSRVPIFLRHNIDSFY